MTPKEVLALCRERDVTLVDLRFADLSSQWHAITIPVGCLTEEIFDDGIGIDGSAFKGWQPIEESDLLIVPQPETAFVDPTCQITTLDLICSIHDPFSREVYSRDPRSVARKAISWLKSTSVADSVKVTTGSSFFLLARQQADESGTNIPNAGIVENCFRKLVHETGRCGIHVHTARKAPGNPAQLHIDLKSDCMVRMADHAIVYKHLAASIANEFDAVAHPASVPVGENFGAAFTVAFSLWDNRQPLFAGSEYGGASESAMFAIGGILSHLPALTAFGNSSDESFYRIASNPLTQLATGYSQQDRSVACRIPGWDSSPDSRQIELLFPDMSTNPYLLFSATLMAAVDGIQNKIDPGAPADVWPADDSAEHETHRRFPHFPRTLNESLDALTHDQQFLLRGDVFTSDLIDNWVTLKRTT